MMMSHDVDLKQVKLSKIFDKFDDEFDSGFASITPLEFELKKFGRVKSQTCSW